MVAYDALFEPQPEGHGVVITFPDLGWGVSQGENETDAREMAADMLQTVLAEMIGKGEEVPVARRHRGRQYRPIALGALESAKVELYQAFRASGLRKAELARRLRIPKANVDRLFDLHHASRLEQLEAAFRVLGKRLTISIENAA